MSIQVDNRAGSVDIIPFLKRLGCEVDVTRADFGDVFWMGLGIGGSPTSVGLELKRIPDCIACIQSGRFAGHQLPGLLKCYDHIWLVVIGEYKSNHDGIMMERIYGDRGEYWRPAGGGQRTFMVRDFESWLLTMQVMGGIRVEKFATMEAAALWIKTAYNWFQRGDHKSHQVVYSGKQMYSDQALLVKPSLARRVAKELPGVGLIRSADVARKFHTVEEMTNASIIDWRSIPGFGPALAKKVYDAIHRNGNGK